LVSSLSRYNGLSSLEKLTAEVKTASCLPHKIEDELPRVSNGFDWYEPEAYICLMAASLVGAVLTAIYLWSPLTTAAVW
jgi:hypothetical protein